MQEHVDGHIMCHEPSQSKFLFMIKLLKGEGGASAHKIREKKKPRQRSRWM